MCNYSMVEIPINRVTPPFRTGKVNLLFLISHLLDLCAGGLITSMCYIHSTTPCYKVGVSLLARR